MAVKTHGGLTDRQVIENSVLQGDTWGPILAAVQVDSIAKDIEEANIGYLYKENLQISILGLIDDITGVTDVGYKAQQMNILLNVKSAEKGLQFGVSKCKKMTIGKRKENWINTELFVDGWKESYVENGDTGEVDLVESYIGEVEIEEVTEQRYLGFVISASGNNLCNIKAMENKSIGLIRTIMNKLECLKLRQYYFECAIILMKTILRSSILYAGECYYNLTETQLRSIERIEENYLRKILKTSRGCPIVQMYLECGVWPARFELQKMRCLFLKQILAQDKQSQVYKFFQLQLHKPIKNDWVSTCLKDLSQLKIYESLEEIEIMSERKFKELLKERIKENAFEYLKKGRGSKGQGIKYSELEMSEYLLPYNTELDIEQKRRMFSVKNRMTQIPANFGNSDEKCICGTEENMSHIYECQYLNERIPSINFEELNNGRLKDQIGIFKRFEINMEKRKEIKENMKEMKEILPCDSCNPLNCIQCRNG